MKTLRKQLLVGGAWIDGVCTIPVHDPANGRVVAEVASAGPAECEAAVSAAADAAADWVARPPRVRSEMLRSAFEVMVKEADDLAHLITLENGKTLRDARSEVAYAAEFFRWFAEEAVRIGGDYRAAPTGDKKILVKHEPIGVSLCITPWNFPAAMVTRKLAPALAAGCTAIVKPAAETPLTALAIADILQRTGVPDGVVNVIVPSDVGPMVARMLHDNRVTHLSFTGSTSVGRALLREAADQIVRPSMELGGNAPFLVLEDADVSDAVAGAMIAKLRNGGAACTAANRFYVARPLADKFTKRFAASMRSLRVGAGTDPDVQVGALVSLEERDKVARLVEDAVNEGARVVAGGTTPPGGGAFYPPTVLADVDPHARILEQEIFGPVAPVVIVEDEEEAVARANDTEHGLISYVYTSDLDRGLRVADQIESGMVAINRGLASDPAAPFGGYKQSGIGREGGREGIYEFMETKYIALNC